MHTSVPVNSTLGGSEAKVRKSYTVLCGPPGKRTPKRRTKAEVGLEGCTVPCGPIGKSAM